MASNSTPDVRLGDIVIDELGHVALLLDTFVQEGARTDGSISVVHFAAGLKGFFGRIKIDAKSPLRVICSLEQAVEVLAKNFDLETVAHTVEQAAENELDALKKKVAELEKLITGSNQPTGAAVKP
jgi:hypothetical protein